MKPIDCKTLAEWRNETRALASHFRIKHEKSFQSSTYIPHTYFYRKMSKLYADLYDLLNHLIQYNDYMDTALCNSCKFNEPHRNTLKKTFNNYYPFIIRCKDGERFKAVVQESIKENRSHVLLESNND